MSDPVATITVIDQEGAPHSVASFQGASLMHCVRDAGLPMLAVCGGGISCATCHIYAEGDGPSRLPAPSHVEAALLQALAGYDPKRSRLACQIEIEPALDGLVVTLGPDD